MLNIKIRQKAIAPYIFLLPFVLFFALFRLWPIVWSFIISFFQYTGSSTSQFIGLRNYIDILKNRTFWQATGNTLYFVIVYNCIMIAAAVALAVILNSPLVKGRKLFRSIYFIPIAMSLPVVAIVFDMIFARNIGFISAIFGLFGQKYDLRWFSTIGLAMWGIIIMRLWRGIGYYCVYFLAGLTGISPEIYESAKIDGAGKMKTFFYITLPLLRPMLMFVVIMSTILSFQIFDEPWIIAQGGPANSTLTMQIYLYQTSFLEGNLGKGSAVSYLMTILMMGASILYVNRLGEKETDL
ncbi:carbohydrate ABC transporter permease [Breznakiella homolactica]|uniref:Sugar ABC transporter permease n=1 Tax=Breznakiella homolactica TaxID=2798577 RepID=A0A7T8BC38_9SPIR|nr:sugar ABC transporter permease [Breznakiella homolactica]QQO11031.1 sugar ABC transporter permease [Breznakiella homolactica]